MNGRRVPILAPTDLPVLVLLVSACAAVWPAYDRSLCWPALAAMAAGVVVYFSASRLPAGGRAWRMAAGISVAAAVALAAYFLTQFGRLGYAGKIAGVERPAAWLGALSPAVGRWAPDRNSVASGLEGVLFLAAALAWTSRRLAGRAVWGTAAAALALALVLSASRGAWLAVAVSGAVWAAIRHERLASRPALLAGAIAMPLLAGLAWLAAVAWWPDITGSGAMTAALDRPDRIALYRQSAVLIGDAPFTGIGLGGQFAMNLSRYVLLIQVPFLTYSHNLYLETWLQLGVAGAAALAWLTAAFVMSFRALPQARQATLAQGAGLGFLAVLLHGLVDARPYVDHWSGLPALVLLGLFSAAVVRAETGPLRRSRRLASAAAAAVFLAAALAWVWPVRASWHANLGAVTQARAELGRVPPEAPVAPDLREAEGRFRRALTVDPRHPTASVRLALMEMDAGRFEAAAGYAEPAWRADRLSVRTRKALGLARMWAGDLDGAHPLLDGLPGLVGELNAWGFWRSRRHEPVLALRAYTMSLLLEPDQPAVRRAAASLSQIGGKAP